MRLRIALPTALAVLVAAVPAATARELVVVQANVGNVNVPGCGQHVFKLCQRPVEERAAEALRALDPDVVAFEEILPPELCEQTPSLNPYNLCSAPLEPPSQVVRLLGPGYDVACDSRYGWDCLAVRQGVGAIGADWETRPVLEGCEDDGFTLSAGTVELAGSPVAVAVAHPSSTDAPCRAEQIRDLFESLPADGPALLLGDWNLDPYREDDESVRYWKAQVPSVFAYASGEDFTSYPGAPSQLDPTGMTMDGDVLVSAGPLETRTIDHVLVRDLAGSCEVRRIDGGGGMDHRAQVCAITVGGEAPPA